MSLLHPSHSLSPLVADCPEHDRMSVGFCVPPFEVGIPRKLTNLYSFVRRVCTRCTHSYSASSTVAFTWIHPLARSSVIPSYATRDEPTMWTVPSLGTNVRSLSSDLQCFPQFTDAAREMSWRFLLTSSIFLSFNANRKRRIEVGW